MRSLVRGAVARLMTACYTTLLIIAGKDQGPDVDDDGDAIELTALELHTDGIDALATMVSRDTYCWRALNLTGEDSLHHHWDHTGNPSMKCHQHKEWTLPKLFRTRHLFIYTCVVLHGPQLY